MANPMASYLLKAEIIEEALAKERSKDDGAYDISECRVSIMR